MSDIIEIKKIRSLLALNTKWSKLSPSKKGLKLQEISDKFFLNFPCIKKDEFPLVHNGIVEALEKEDLLLNKGINPEIDQYVKKRREFSKEEGEDLDLITIHFEDCDYIIEVFSVQDFEDGIICPYFTVNRVDSKFKEFVDLFMNSPSE